MVRAEHTFGNTHARTHTLGRTLTSGRLKRLSHTHTHTRTQLKIKFRRAKHPHLFVGHCDTRCSPRPRSEPLLTRGSHVGRRPHQSSGYLVGLSSEDKV